MTKAKPKNDQALLETETPEEQVARMGNTWTLPEQYEKQLQLPVHAESGELVLIERDGNMRPGYRTVCGLALGGEGNTMMETGRGEGTIRISGNPDEVTCAKCRKG